MISLPRCRLSPDPARLHEYSKTLSIYWLIYLRAHTLIGSLTLQRSLITWLNKHELLVSNCNGKTQDEHLWHCNGTSIQISKNDLAFNVKSNNSLLQVKLSYILNSLNIPWDIQNTVYVLQYLRSMVFALEHWEAGAYYPCSHCSENCIHHGAFGLDFLPRYVSYKDISLRHLSFSFLFYRNVPQRYRKHTYIYSCISHIHTHTWFELWWVQRCTTMYPPSPHKINSYAYIYSMYLYMYVCKYMHTCTYIQFMHTHTYVQYISRHKHCVSHHLRV